MLIGTVMYNGPSHQEMRQMKLEYEKQWLEEVDQEFTEESIIGKTKGEILKRYGRATDSTATTMFYDFSSSTSSFVVEIEIENGEAVRLNKIRN